MPNPTEGAPEPVRRVVADDPPPFLGAWRRVYAAIVIYLAFLIFAFYVFSRVYAP